MHRITHNKAALPLNLEIARKVLSTVDAGLVHGMGDPIPGKMCVEAAVCYAYGIPHSDNPPCVGAAVRQFKIRLNDSFWSSDAARTIGMRKIAIAQLGSDSIDQVAFCRMVAEQTIRQIVPIALRAAAKLNPAHADAIEASAVRCEREGTDTAARDARIVARKARYAADVSVSVSVSASAAASAAAALYAYADASAYATAAATAAAYAATTDADVVRDKVLNVCADIGLQALIDLKSPGCEYLYLCDEVAA